LRAKRENGVMEQLSAKPILIVDSIAFSLTTGKAPGKAKHTGHV
jgi:hypothetical protein